MGHLLAPGKGYPRNCKLGQSDPQGDPITPPTIADVGDTEPNSTEAQGAHDITPSLLEHPLEEETPPVEPIASPAEVDVGHTPSDPVGTLPDKDATVLSIKP